MIDKIIVWFGSAQDALRELDAKAKAEAIKYSNRQVKKAAVAGVIVGVAATLVVQAVL